MLVSHFHTSTVQARAGLRDVRYRFVFKALARDYKLVGIIGAAVLRLHHLIRLSISLSLCRYMRLQFHAEPSPSQSEYFQEIWLQ